jgi:hypothetical protein
VRHRELPLERQAVDDRQLPDGPGPPRSHSELRQRVDQLAATQRHRRRAERRLQSAECHRHLRLRVPALWEPKPLLLHRGQPPGATGHPSAPSVVAGAGPSAAADAARERVPIHRLCDSPDPSRVQDIRRQREHRIQHCRQHHLPERMLHAGADVCGKCCILQSELERRLLQHLRRS